MVVQHNMQAANTNRMLNLTVNGQQKSTEKLSSGYRINRAADDAAGLAISEKMRSQIRGLDRASTNAQDGISVVQTAEGALNEVHSMLQRMNELATQAANDTNTDKDRGQIQLEVNQLVSEIDRVASTTQFNTMNLLDGSFTGKNLQVGSLSGQTIKLDIDAMDATSLGLKGSTTTTEEIEGKHGTITLGGTTETYSDINSPAATTDYTLSGLTNGKTYVYDAATDKWHEDGDITQTAVTGIAAVGDRKFKDGAKIAATGAAAGTLTGGMQIKSTVSDADIKVTDDVLKAAKDGVYTFDGAAWKNDAGETLTVTYNNSKTANDIPDGATLTIKGNVAAETKTTTTKKMDVTTHDGAEAAMQSAQDAIDKVSTQRATLGAVQNRLEHTIANLDTTSENTQAAESRIRDTDMAKEMVTWSKNNILAQAGQSMLAQANQSNQGVLSLLQ